MQILQITALSAKQFQDINALEAACQKHDNISLTFPIEDGSIYFLLYDKETLLSVFSAFFNGIDAWECSAFTRPDDRRNGYFSDLLDRFLEESEVDEADRKMTNEETAEKKAAAEAAANAQFDLVFAVDESCADTMGTLKAIDARLWYREHMMKLQIAEYAQMAEKPSHPDTAVSISPPINQKTVTEVTVFQINIGGSRPETARQAGSFRLDFRGKTVYFYGFEVNEGLRGQGVGTGALRLLLHQLSRLGEVGPETVFLQVSDNNLPAMSVYRKAGFRITDTVSYYVY